MAPWIARTQAEWTKSGDMVVDDSEAEQEAGSEQRERRGTRRAPRGTRWGVDWLEVPQRQGGRCAARCGTEVPKRSAGLRETKKPSIQGPSDRSPIETC